MEDSVVGRLDKIIELLELLVKREEKEKCSFQCNCLSQKQSTMRAQSGRSFWCPVHGTQFY